MKRSFVCSSRASVEGVAAAHSMFREQGRAIPFQLSWNAKTSAAAIVEVDDVGVAGRCQNHGSYWVCRKQ